MTRCAVSAVAGLALAAAVRGQPADDPHVVQLTRSPAAAPTSCSRYSP